MSINYRPGIDYNFARHLFWGRTFGLFIKECRDRTGRSTEEAARLAGMEARNWKAMEAGMAPEPEQFHLIADALGVSLDVIQGLATFCQAAWDD
jgi:transcriptional regulator with XRE-family HTH domain